LKPWAKADRQKRGRPDDVTIEIVVAGIDPDHPTRLRSPVTKPPHRRQSLENIEFSRHFVRVVGPVFLPDPEAAIDLKAQARTKVR
jgi:hypothetical protein